MSQWSISLSEEPSGGVSAFMHIQADTNLEAQEVGFELDLPENVYAELCVRQYVDTGEEYTNVVAWTTINTSGAQQFMVPINKAYVKAGGPTILQMTFRTVGSVNIGTGVATQWKNYWTYLSHYVSQTHIATICEEKDNYRFGFNGMEKDNEAKGIGNSLDFGARIYDSRLGRFLSLDPLAAKNPMLSPYAFAANNPIALIDKNGEEPTLAAYKKAAEKLGVPIASIRAVYKSEVGGDAYFSGKAKILFERHYFSRLTNQKFDKTNPTVSDPKPGGYGRYSGEYSKLSEAMQLDENAAYMSASYGGFQLMGENYKAAGFSSPKEMYETLTSDDEDKHLEAFTNFIMNDKSTNPKKGVTMTKWQALKERNWTQFAKCYNGPSQKGYDKKMEDNYEKLSENEEGGLEQEEKENSKIRVSAPSIDSSIEGVKSN